MKRHIIILALILVVFRAGDKNFISRAEINSSETDQLKPELVLQTGHNKSVETVVFSPGNQWVASGSFDNTIKIWDFSTGRELRALTGHTGAVKTLACSKDGRLLASGSNDKTVRVWDVESGNEIKSFTIQDGFVETIAFSGDGQKLAAGTSVNAVTIWNALSGQEISKLSEHTSAVTALAFSPDDRFLASGSNDTTIKIWDALNGRRIRNLKGHTDKVQSLEFSPNGELLASGSADKSVRLWKTSNGRELSVFKEPAGKVLSLRFTADGKLRSVDSAHIIKIWDTTNLRLINSETEGKSKNSINEAETAAFSFDGKYLATGSGDRTISLSDTETGEKLRTLENQTSGYYGVAFSADRHWLASASFDNTVKLWDLQTGQGLPPLTGHTGYVTCVVFHPDNQQVISASVDKTISIWDTVAGKSLYTLTGHTNSISSLAVGSQGKLLVSGSADQTIGLWDLETKKQTGSLTGHSGEVVSVSISPDEKLIASASTDRTIKLWDVRTKTLLRTLEGHSAEVDAVAFSPDGQFIASGGVDKTVRLWEVATGGLVKTFTGHEGKINTVSFSPDGKQIVSGSRDRSVRIWNVSDGQKNQILSGHVGTVFSVALTADGQWLASASDDGSIIIWNKESGKSLSTLVSLKDGADWLVVSPDGFFDGSPAAWEQLLWRFGKNTFNVKPVEVFFNEFYSPGLLADLLTGEKLPSTGDISQKDRRQPELKISLADGQLSAGSVAERQVKIKIDVSEIPPGNGYKSGSGARDVRLFRNGSLVKLWSGSVLDKSGQTELETTVSLVSGQNQLTAYGFNNESIKSSDARLIVNGAENLKRKGVFYIIAVGVGKYANPKYNLNFVELDAKEFGEQLRRKQAELNQFERIEVVPLFNQDATKNNIISAFNRLAGLSNPGENSPSALEKLKRAEPEDAVAIFFSGHGTSQNGHFYVLPHDLGYTDPNQPLDAERLKTVLLHSISDLELELAFREIDAGKLLLVIDACNSGQALESVDQRRGPMNNKGLAQLAYDKGMYILTASQSIESAYVSGALKRSYLSYALIEEGLKTPVADIAPVDGQITIREWFDYAVNRVPKLRKDVTAGIFKSEQKKGLEEEEEPVKNSGSQRPRVFYRRQNDLRSLIVSGVR
ncbi:MAG TPA: caspase family protein [Pyrinomonadaceae bacterium]|nr:caspase family protein [Pyrinomonadaceae bacterium]